MAPPMDFDPSELDSLSREDLILRARARGVERPEQMTRIELRDEIVRRSEPDLERQRRSRGWLGVARDLLASVVESGLNLPDAAAAIRGDAKGDLDLQGPPPVATVTLAEIYATQGHYEQALEMLDQVLAGEPEHASAIKLRARLVDERDQPRRRRTDAAKLTSTPPARASLPAEVVLPPPAPTAAPPVAPPAPAASESTSSFPPGVVVLRSGARVFVYWRLPDLSPAHRLRTATVRPSPVGPTVEQQDHPLASAVGGFWLPRLGLGHEVRAAVGELLSEGFVPLAVASVSGTDGAGSPGPPLFEVEPALAEAARAAASG